MEEQNTKDLEQQAESAKPKPAKKRTAQDIIDSEMRRLNKQKKAIQDDDINLQWYIVQAYSNQENKAKEQLEEGIKSGGLERFFGDIVIPQEEVIELVKGEKQTANKKFFPGYILVQMHVNEDSWHLIKNTPKIVGFVGDTSSPIPMEQEEVDRLLSQMEEGTAGLAAGGDFSEGDLVKVTDGPFVDFTGTIEEVKPDKGKLRVLISIFGRATPVELGFFQVEKQ